MNSTHKLCLACIMLFASMAVAATDNEGSIWDDNPYYLGISMLNLVDTSSYTSSWSGISGIDNTWETTTSINNNQGFGGSIEIGKSMYERAMGISLAFVFTNIKSSTIDENIAISSALNGIMLGFEYVKRGDYGLDFYVGAGIGSALISNQGIYSNILAAESTSQYNQYLSSDFSDSGEWTLIYDFKLGMYVSSNLPLSIKLGLQILGTGDLENTNNMSGVGNSVNMYNKTSSLGSSNQYGPPTATSTSTNNLHFQIGTIELGIQYLFIT